MMYSNKIMEEFYNPENYGVIKGASGVGKVVSDVGSEIIKIYIKVEGDKVTEAQYQTYGGVVAIACTNIATKLIMGKSLSAISRMNENNILEITGEIPENKMYVVTLVVNAMHAAVESYYNKSAKDD